MNTMFYLSFEVTPSDEGLVDKRIENAQAHCWVIEDDHRSAAIKASYRVQQSGWKILSQDTVGIAVTLENFRDRDLGEEMFREAEDHGIAIFLVGNTTAQELQTEVPIRQKVHENFDLHSFIQTQKSVRSQGRCLFYQRRNECSEIIDAHSIQKNGSLSKIARDGYVYAISQKFTDIRRNKGGQTWARIHINSMSVFRGLCHHHDSSLFRPIDVEVLIPTLEQVFLYAYRCIFKERYAKECAVEIATEQLKSFNGTNATRNLLEAVRDGNAIGLTGLTFEQELYDESHHHKRFEDIRYVMFESSKAPTCVFSGQIYPDWGFNGEQIQDLYDRRLRRSLLTFSFAPTEAGWAFLIAWHKASDAVGRHFVSTLQTAIRNGKRAEDLLFGLVVKGCENTAYSPEWAEARTEEEKRLLERAMTEGSDVLKLIDRGYLSSGIESIHEWCFDSVHDNLH